MIQAKTAKAKAECERWTNNLSAIKREFDEVKRNLEQVKRQMHDAYNKGMAANAEMQKESERLKSEIANQRLVRDDIANQKQKMEIELTRMRQRLGV